MDIPTLLTSIATSATVAALLAALVQKWLISKIEIKQQEKIELLKSHLASGQQREIELLKSRLTADIEHIRYINNSSSGIYISSNQERVAALKAAWQLFIDAKSHQPILVIVVCDLMRKQDAQNLSKPPSAEVGRMIKAFDSQEYFNKIMPIVNEINKLKPFIGLEIWGLLTTYTSIISRIALQIGESITNEFRQYYWLDDEHLVKSIIGKIMNIEKLNEVIARDSFRGLINYIELEIVEHINSQLTGKAFSLAHVQLASEIKSSADSLGES
jgi:hypothetical protein